MPKVQSMLQNMQRVLRSAVVLAASLLWTDDVVAKSSEASLGNPVCVFQPEADALAGPPACADGPAACKAQRFAEMLDGIKCKATSGDAEAAYMLGKMYLHGIHVEADRLLASRYWRLAAGYGHAVAQHDYAMLLLTEGSPKTEEVDEALYWLGTSASAGHAVSALVLGRIYEVGWYNVTPDPLLAEIWYEAGEEMGMHRSPNDLGQAKNQEALSE